MKDFNVDFCSLNNNNPETRNMLSVLMSEIDDGTDLETVGESFFIEAYPQTDDSCVLFISAINEDGIRDLTEMYDLTDVEQYSDLYEKLSDLSDLQDDIFSTVTFSCQDSFILEKTAKMLLKCYGDFIPKSFLYKRGSEYRLVLEVYKDVEASVANLLIEFGKIMGNDPILYAYTQEYYECIMETQALQELTIDN
jgi:hypothetical protein